MSALEMPSGSWCSARMLLALSTAFRSPAFSKSFTRTSWLTFSKMFGDAFLRCAVSNLTPLTAGLTRRESEDAYEDMAVETDGFRDVPCLIAAAVLSVTPALEITAGFIGDWPSARIPFRDDVMRKDYVASTALAEAVSAHE